MEASDWLVGQAIVWLGKREVLSVCVLLIRQLVNIIIDVKLSNCFLLSSELLKLKFIYHYLTRNTIIRISLIICWNMITSYGCIRGIYRCINDFGSCLGSAADILDNLGGACWRQRCLMLRAIFLSLSLHGLGLLIRLAFGIEF